MNIDYHKRLESQVEKMGLTHRTFDRNSKNFDWSVDVVFILNVEEVEKIQLMRTAVALIYTPSNEHFGIVPIEAM